MDKPEVTMRTVSEVDDALLIIGVPFEQGVLHDDSLLRLSCDGKLLPLWWEKRAMWTDGSIKWILIHTRVPSGQKDLSLEVSSECDGQTSAGQIWLSDTCIEINDMRLSVSAENWLFETDEGTWELLCDNTETDLGLASGGMRYKVELIESSPIAPLIKVVPTHRATGLIREQLLRLDVSGKRLIWTRRLMWNREGDFWLNSSCANLKFLSKGPKDCSCSDNCLAQAGSTFIAAPGQVRYDRNCDVQEYPQGRLDFERHSLWVEKAWQRAPLSVVWNDNQVELYFYPKTARPLGVKGGTSYRHTVHLCCGEAASKLAGHQVKVEFTSGYLCKTGALGALYALDIEGEEYMFPGFRTCFRTVLDSGRLARLNTDATTDGLPVSLEKEELQDKDYFGLQHYGDWPMPWGAYGAKDRRIYTSNEYDTPYCYYQGYAVFSDWRYYEIAHHGAIHMADVDCISMDGDMRYHGYSDDAEDHEHRRTKGDFGHYWTDGLWMLYFFSGDIWAKQAAESLTTFLVKRFTSGGESFMRMLWSHAERSLGWPIVAMIGTYEATLSKQILQCIERIVEYMDKFTSCPDREVEEESGSVEQPIIWWRTAMQDGSKPFMLGVIMEGLERYHRITGSTAAERALLRMADFVVREMWLPHRATFRYEYNAFGRGHRVISPQSLIPLFVRGLGYAYEISTEDRFREVSEKAFHACIWTLLRPQGGKDIGIVGRTMGAYVSMLNNWIEHDREIYIRSLSKSTGRDFSWEEGIRGLVDSGKVVVLNGTARYDDSALISENTSYVAGKFVDPLNTDSGEMQFRVKLHEGTTTWLNQRAYIHLCDDEHTKSCLSVITFYTNLHVRVYDSKRRLIEVAEGHIKNYDANGDPVVKAPNPEWHEGHWHDVRVVWEAPGELILFIDGIQADRRILDRPISGEFKRIHIGHKPGNWRINGEIELVRLFTCGS